MKKEREKWNKTQVGSSQISAYKTSHYVSLSLTSLCVLSVLLGYYILSSVHKEEGSTLSSEVGIQSHSSSVNGVLRISGKDSCMHIRQIDNLPC